MVCEWGMSDELGALTYGKKDEQVFLGKEIGQARDFSDDTARQIDLAVKNIADTSMEKVFQLLSDHRDILDKMSEELLTTETIVLSDVERIVEDLRPGVYTDRMTVESPEADDEPEETQEEKVDTTVKDTTEEKVTQKKDTESPQAEESSEEKAEDTDPDESKPQ